MIKSKKIQIWLCFGILILTGCGKTDTASEQDFSDVATTEMVSTEKLTTEKAVDMSSQQSYIEQVKQRITTYALNEEQQIAFDTLIVEYENAIAEQNIQLCKDKEEEITVFFAELDDEKVWNDAKMKNQYAGILRRAYYDVIGYYSSFEDMENPEEDSMADKYSIYDIDSDGKDELLLSVTSSSMAGMSESIYDYDLNSNELMTQLSEFPLTTYYDNGVITAGWSHNQGLGPDFTPYDLYQYEVKDDTYIKIGSVDTWDKEYFPVDTWTDTVFPDEIDSDGDGVIFMIRMDAEQEEKWYDNAAYEEWLQSYIGNANKVEIPWQSLHSEEWQNYASNYIEMIIDRRKNVLADEETDIGVTFLESEAYTDVVVDELSQKYNFRLEKDEQSELVEYGYIDDQLVLNIYNEGVASLEYSNVAIDNLSIFGIYPGITMKDADSMLKKYGFYKENEAYYTGNDHGNYMIYITEEGECVNGIALYQHSMFSY